MWGDLSMPLYDNPPHRADLYSPATGSDSGAGTTINYTLAQSSVPCFAPTVSSGEQERFGQTQIVTQHGIHFKASAVTVALARGWKLVVNGVSLHITGIKANQAAGGIPALLEVSCESLQ